MSNESEVSEFAINAEPRELVGKGASRRLRRLDEKVPAIIYGGEEKPTNLSLSHREIAKALENKAFYSHILTINIAGKKHRALLKDLQRHPFKPRIMHVDFQRITGKEILHRNVTLRFLNEELAPGVKTHGGIVNHHLRDVEIKCAVDKLPESIDVDLKDLGLDESIHLSDLKLPAGISLVALSHGEGHDQPVASIQLPRAAVETAEAAPAVAAEAPPETK